MCSSELGADDNGNPGGIILCRNHQPANQHKILDFDDADDDVMTGDCGE
jgi:hypothetical protein